MAKGRNNLLGVGGQRNKFARSQMRGSGPASRGSGPVDAQAAKRELLRKLKEKTQSESQEKERPGDHAGS